jgi:hypothetical protein
LKPGSQSRTYMILLSLPYFKIISRVQRVRQKWGYLLFAFKNFLNFLDVQTQPMYFTLD